MINKNTHVLIPQILSCDPLDLVHAHGLNGILDLLRREASSAGDDLPPNILRNRRRAIEAEQQRRLELALRALDLSLGRRSAHARPLAERKVHKVVQVAEVLRDEVDPPQARVRVRRREAHVRVGEAVRGHDVAQARREQRRRAEGAVPVAEDGLEDEHREVVRRAPAHALDRERKVDRRHRVVPDAHLRTHKVRPRVQRAAQPRRLGGHGQPGKVFLGELHERRVVYAARTDEHHPVRSVVRLNVLLEIGAFDRLDVFARTEDGAAEWLA